MIYDIAVIGAGPAGTLAAGFCAAGGMRTVLIDRERFPREKVCGDCLNPAAWPLLERFGVEERVRALTHAALREVEFISPENRSMMYPLPQHQRGEIGIRRGLLDTLLLERAGELGAEILLGEAVIKASETRSDLWTIHTATSSIETRHVIAADGRNSTIARSLGLLPSAGRDRVAFQTHMRMDFPSRVTMRFLPFGYCGLAAIGEGLVNLCLVARAKDIGALKHWAGQQFKIPADHEWNTISPLSRKAITPLHGRLMLVGDVARVVEPFTGEGIYYALASGELAARHLLAGTVEQYPAAHRDLYRGRLWLNQLAKSACLYPRLANLLIRIANRYPPLLGWMTRKVTGSA
jgi:menaquinone-9 beta-reductase